MGREPGGWGWGGGGWDGVVSGLNSSDGKLSVCRRVKTVHDYSAGLLISISFGEAPAPS